jgi:hypothetical protein
MIVGSARLNTSDGGGAAGADADGLSLFRV